MAASLSLLCGQLVLIGLEGPELSAREKKTLANGDAGGVVLFKRNIPDGEEGPRAIIALVRSMLDATRSIDGPPPLVSIDQEGGRVARIGPPAIVLPPMRRIGQLGNVDLARRLAEAQGRELAAMGINMNFSPVADIHTRPENPVIGHRAFAETPDEVVRFARAWAEGLTRGAVLTCAKHFPGHGDTTVDSHLTLPRVERSREELERIEIASFRALAKDPAIDSMMVAHIIFPALDPARPSSLSRAACTDLLRGELGFKGVLFTDDLEMKAIQLSAAEAAVLAIAAGCDSALACQREEFAAEAHEGLVREAEKSAAFRARCEEARARFEAMRRRVPPRPVDAEALAGVFAASAAVAAELAQATGSSHVSGAS